MDGPRNPHDILAVLGEKELQKYLVNEIQEVYRLQGVNINDKHIEVIVRQMMRWVKVEDIGDTEFLLEEQVDKFKLPRRERARDRSRAASRRPGRPLLLGITKASLSTDSFISAASLPGDHARAHRSRHQRQGGLPARPEGERHHGPPDPGRHRHGVLPQRRLSPEMEEAAAKVQAEVSAAYEEAERALELMRQEGETDELTAEIPATE